MGKNSAPKSFKKFASRKLPKILETRTKKRKVKQQIKERVQKRVKREELEDKREDAEHIQTIENLKKQDPEEHKYIQDEDYDAQDFRDELQGIDDVDDDDDDDLNLAELQQEQEAPLWAQDELDASSDDEDDDEEEDEDEPQEKAADDDEVTNQRAMPKKEFQEWIAKKRLKRICLAFRAAIAVYEGDEKRIRATPRKWRVVEPEMAEEVVVQTFKNGVKILDYHTQRLGKSSQGKMPHECQGFFRVKPFAQNFLCSVARALRYIKNADVLVVALNSCIPLCPYVAPFSTLRKVFLKRLLSLVTHEVEGVRFQAFLNIRELARLYKYPFVDLCMKGLFLTLVRVTKCFTRGNLALVAFLMNCVVVLFGEDITAAYQQTFIYIRQLATYLRTALKSPNQENFRLVYHWQFVNSFRVLAMVVCQYLKPNELWPLVYPLCQLGIGVLDLFPSPKCFPLHLNIIGILNRIARSSGVYIPVPQYLLRIIASPEFKKKYRRTKMGIAPDLVCTLRAKTSAMQCFSHHSAILQEALFYLLEHLALHAHCIGFPELVVPTLMELGSTRKKMQMTDWQFEVRDMLREIDNNSNFIKERRKGVPFGPKDADKVTLWETETKAAGPPLVKYYEQMHKARADQLQTQAHVHQQKKRKVLEDELEKANDDGDDLENGSDEGSKSKRKVPRMPYDDDKDEVVEDDMADDFQINNDMNEDEDDAWEDEGRRGGRRKQRKSKG